MPKRLIIIGGGIIGLATAYKLGSLLPDFRICILEKEAKIGQHQSGHNSGVLHCGLHYRPGSLKAQLAVKGISEMIAFCQEQNIQYEVCGKLIVATNASEIARMRALKKRGEANGLKDLRELCPAEIREIEPNVFGIAALHVPQEGIVDYSQVALKLAEKIKAAGNEIACNQRALFTKRIRKKWLVQSPDKEYRADYLVACAGLHADRVAKLSKHSKTTFPKFPTNFQNAQNSRNANDSRDFQNAQNAQNANDSRISNDSRNANDSVDVDCVRIVPFRGEYYSLKPDKCHLIRHLVYPVPDPDFPFLGAHFTRRIGGGISAGPSAVLAFSREGYKKTDICLADCLDALAFPGLWRFVMKHPKMTLAELARSFSKKRFCKALQKLVPAICPDDLMPSKAGVRAQAMSAKGALIEDFAWIERESSLHILNAPSPAATASLAIGEAIARRIQRHLSKEK